MASSETRMGRWHLAQLVSCGLLCAFAFALPLPCFGAFVSPMVSYFGCSVTEVNLYFSFMTIAAVVSCAFGGRILSRWMRPTVLIGSLVMAGSYVLLALHPSIALVWAVGVVAGLCYPLCSSVLVPLVINEWFAKDQGTFAGISFALVGLSGVLFGPALTVLILRNGWQAALIIAASAMAVVCVFVVVALLRSSPVPLGVLPYGMGTGLGNRAAGDGGSQTPFDHRAEEVPAHATIILIAAISLLSGMLGDLNTQVNAIAQKSGFDAVAGGVAFSCISGGLFCGKILLGRVRDRRGARSALEFGCIVGVLAFSVLGVSLLLVNPTLLFAGALFAGFCTCLGTMTPALLCSDAVPPNRYAAYVAYMTSFCNVGMALGAPLYSLSMDMAGTYLPIIAGLALISVVCIALTRRALGRA